MNRPVKRFNGDSPFRPQPKPVRKLKPEKKAIAKKSVQTISELRDEADKVWSEYIRQYYADPYGKVQCVTCPNKDHWKKMHCGHFVSRGQYSVRFDFRNCHPQCPECNIVKSGNLEEYERYIDFAHGKGTAEELKRLARVPFKLEREHLLHVIDNYKVINR